MMKVSPLIDAITQERKRRAAGKLPTGSLPAMLDEVHRLGSEALAYRLGGPEPTSDDALHFVGRSFPALVEDLLTARGERWDSPAQMFHRAIGTGDVAALLTGAGNRILLKAYESYSGGLIRFCQDVQTRDLRDVKAIQVDGDMTLQEVPEGGTFASGTLTASAESFPIKTFGRLVGWTPRAFSNDDLHAFANIAAQLGRMAAEFASAQVVAVLEDTTALGDGVAPFATGHKNLGTGGALSETTLGELLKLMRKQTGLGGEGIAAVPKALVVPPALELTARKLVWVMGQPSFLEVAVEPRLTSATAFFVVSGPDSVAPIAYTYGPGAAGPTIEVGKRRSFQGLGARVSLDFGAGWSDFRGAAKNVGA